MSNTKEQINAARDAYMRLFKQAGEYAKNRDIDGFLAAADDALVEAEKAAQLGSMDAVDAAIDAVETIETVRQWVARGIPADEIFATPEKIDSWVPGQNVLWNMNN